MNENLVVEKCAEDIVNKMCVYGKIKLAEKNLWANEIVEYLKIKKTDYTPIQHNKVVDVIPVMDFDHGIEILLNYIKNVQDETLQIEAPKEEASPIEIFELMSHEEKINKCKSWLTCGCPKKAIPNYIYDYLKVLDEDLKSEMRKLFVQGQETALESRGAVKSLAKEMSMDNV